MAKIDWTPEDTVMLPGIYLFKVNSCEERMARSGNAYFSVKLNAVGHDGAPVYDAITLVGRGRGIGQAKLKALGLNGTERAVETHQIEGRTVYAAIVSEEYGGKRRMKVDITQGSAGYWSSRDPAPAGVAETPTAGEPEPADVAPDDDIPF